MVPFSGNLRRFRPAGSGRRKLPFPAAPNLRIAQVSAAAALFDSAEPFPPGRWDGLEPHRPHVLVGAAAELRELADRVRLGALDLSSVDRAIFVLTPCGDKPADDVLRVVLWQAFGVPVYELFVGADGMVLASECDAHEGWHVEPCATFSLMDAELILDLPRRDRVQTGLTGHIESDPCPCGRAGPRLIGVEDIRDIGDIGDIEHLDIEHLDIEHRGAHSGRKLAATA